MLSCYRVIVLLLFLNMAVIVLSCYRVLVLSCCHVAQISCYRVIVLSCYRVFAFVETLFPAYSVHIRETLEHVRNAIVEDRKL